LPIVAAEDLRRLLGAETWGGTSGWLTTVAVFGPPSDVASVAPDKDPILTIGEMSKALDRVSKPAEHDDPPLPFNPDGYPLF
jgi:hypothetical protein